MVSTRAQKAASKTNRRNASNPHHNTPQKTRIKALAEITKTKAVWNGAINLTQIFKSSGVSMSRGKEILKEDAKKTRVFPHNRETETRGRKSVISDAQIRVMERIIEEADIQERSMSWEALAIEAGVDCCARTVRRAMHKRGYKKCIACRKSYVDPKLASKRIKYARDMLNKYPRPEDWRRVRFSDKCHFGLGPQGNLLIIRKRG
jgi:transposase